VVENTLIAAGRAHNYGSVRGDDLFGENARRHRPSAADYPANTALADPVWRPERRYPVAPRSQQDIP
jgi:hypothetical protein